MAELQKLINVRDQVLSWMPQSRPLSVAEVIAALGRGAPAPVGLTEALQELAQSVLTEFSASREREARVWSRCCSTASRSCASSAGRPSRWCPKLVELQRQRFLERWNEALGAAQADAAAQAAQERALAEATAFAIRIDVAEELTRLQSHLDEIERLIGKGGEVGKRLDFFIQELHREANTWAASPPASS